MFCLIAGSDWFAALLQCNTKEKNIGHGFIFQLQAVMLVKTAETCMVILTMVQMSDCRVMTRCPLVVDAEKSLSGFVYLCIRPD